MANSFTSFAPDTRPVDALSRAQIGLILGLETVLQQAGWVLLCPRCAAEGYPSLQTGNSESDPVWKIDCQCRCRRVNRADAQPMAPTGDLLLLVEDLLGPLSLAVRCPSHRCLMKPLELRQTVDGLAVTCHCGGQFLFRKTGKTTKPN